MTDAERKAIIEAALESIARNTTRLDEIEQGINLNRSDNERTRDDLKKLYDSFP